MHKRWREYWVSMDEVRKEKEIKKIVTVLVFLVPAERRHEVIN